MKTGRHDFVAPYYTACSSCGTEDSKTSNCETTQSLEKAIKSTAVCARYEWLSQAYSRSPKTQVQAVNAAIQAVKLDRRRFHTRLTSRICHQQQSVFRSPHHGQAHPGGGFACGREMADTILRRLEQAEQQAANTSSGRALPSSLGNAPCRIRNDGEARTAWSANHLRIRATEVSAS